MNVIQDILRSKKGIFFTIISISILGLILFSYSITYSYTLQEKAFVIETRIDTMNRFLKEIDIDMRNAIYISGFRSLVGMTDYITTNHVFVSDTSAAFELLFFNGTIGGTNSSVMLNNTFYDWIDKMAIEGQKVGLNITIVPGGLSIRHTSPWLVTVYLNATVNVTDFQQIASWETNKSVSSEISILSFEDPSYAFHSLGHVIKRVYATPYDGNYTEAAGTNTTNLQDHIKTTYYAAFNSSPDFLSRFENNLSADIYGIESIVNKTEISTWKSCSTKTSSVDHFYWVCNNTNTVFKLSDIPNFRLDNETDINGTLGRVDKYMIGDVAIEDI